MTRWTGAQESAIEIRNKNLLVSAAAGSGKTAVLVERIIRLIIDDRVEVERLLVVTFTKAAAEEMKHRISSTLSDKLSNAEGAERAYISRQISALPFASISTIHSFCSNVVRRYSHVIGIDSSLKIGNETVLSILKQRAMDNILDSEYESGDVDFINTLESFGEGRRDQKLREVIEAYYNFTINRPKPQIWSEENLGRFSMDLMDFNNSEIYETFKEIATIRLDHAMGLLKKARTMILGLENGSKAEQIIEDEINQIVALTKSLDKGFEKFRFLLDTAVFARLTIKTEKENLKSEIVQRRNESKEIVKSLQTMVGYEKPETMIENINEMEPTIRYLNGLAEKFSNEYSSLKLDKGLMDFNDLEHFALAILDDANVAKEMKKEYSYIFIDEFQDSNQIQNDLAEKIMRSDNLFLVGDVKQSIYRFRLSDPTIFIKRSKEYLNSDQSSCEVIHLNTNFRSSDRVINTINSVFEKVMSSYAGEIDYDENEKLYKGSAIPDRIDDKTEIFLLGSSVEEHRESESDPEEESDIEIEDLTNLEYEARLVAQKIKETLGTDVYDAKNKKYRKIEFKDMVILLRAAKAEAKVYQEVLSEAGIPVYAQSGAGYFDTLEISMVMDLLSIIDNTRQDALFMSVMRSPFFGFKIEDLVEIRTAYPELSFRDGAYAYKEDHKDGLGAAIAAMTEKIEIWKKQSAVISIDKFLWNVLIETDYYSYVGALVGGVQRQANLRMLVDKAKDFSESSLRGLFNFVRFVKELKNTDTDLSTAKVLGPMDNVVRVMSIHKSKGLEFPVVFIGGLGKKFNTRDTSASLILHKDLGICPDYININERRYCETLFKSIVKEKTLLEIISEEMRVLYVAMTRAQNKLIMIGTVSNALARLEKWKREITPFGVSKSSNYLDWIMGSLMSGNEGFEFDNMIYENDDYKVQLIDKGNIYNYQQIKEKYLTEVADHFEKIVNADLKISEEIKRRLQWNYQELEKMKLPAKISVSAIKRFLQTGELADPSEEIRKPVFLQSIKKKSATEIGSANHYVLQNLDISRLKNAVDVQSELNLQLGQMEVDGMITKEISHVINLQAIGNFFQDPLGRRLLASDEINREKRFTLKMDPKEFAKENFEGEPILIQGMIDCFFKEEGQWILVDYKSDYFSSEESKHEKIENYRTQIEFYRRAIEKSTNAKVAEAYLYLLHSGEAVML
ncbi:helicase-exonuclease AddAB subunit AddA [Alkalibacter mobilis]|uniref:helicase-exonuclease AddAB subunit AddA n=1 Tax=Alkalibacter mobilis TaxID=2787712 RepID=UPI0018A03B2E|nr:helicase-exonuclease AddAB subunit AddA [Alkalibacter mobilis]MBF7096019.1 helicase-exonuclease AddAB subunit AddA [Alkalibacter mobilis]